MGLYVQYGCGLSAPDGWINFDSSPTLRIQKLPVLGASSSRFLNARFPKSVRLGDITEGLPIEKNSCDGIYCSHVLEHLSLEDFYRAIDNTRQILKPGALFRLVMPDLMAIVKKYEQASAAGDPSASLQFMDDSGIALKTRPRGLKGVATTVLGNSRHQWLWDYESTISALEDAGFTDIRRCLFNDSADDMFRLVEESDRFENAVALEMTKSH